MTRLLYESSVSYQGYLIIPFVFGKFDNYEIYSYKLLAEIGHKSRFHASENPAKMYCNTIINIIDIAKEHIDVNIEFVIQVDFFKSRYVYRHNLIIVYQKNGKCYYDHYAPESLSNIAAPKLFSSPHECLSWVQKGLDGKSN
ncbi:hypothetical protein H6G06_04825 [Anabaena sphaerica FACHB-251]|uniref:Uncharacterized protein n=1 Tax=Anabaena sphaerica FACHB-251 TaxID=2692883 RepID=A0A926WE13_9NOST|nr:hypothetical protein [Anabaena sphaerica]MBD2292824.1 hypothetical protein [Anabaena sphaerica FACHB-251]